MDSYVLTVEKAITAHLALNIDSQYNVSDNVVRGRDRIGANEKVPMVSLIQTVDIDDTSLTAGNDNNNRIDGKLYLVQGFLQRGDIDNPTDLIHGLMAETKRVLSIVNSSKAKEYCLRNYNTSSERGLVANIDISSGIVRPPDNDISSKYSFFWLPIRVKLIEDVANPYSLPT